MIIMTLKIMFTSDVHGSEPAFRKFINSARIYRASHLILGGDITGKGLIIVSKSEAGYRTNYLGTEITARNETEFEKFRSQARMRGYYVYVDTPDVIQELKFSTEKRDQVLANCVKETLRSWLKLAEDRLKGTEIKCHISPGNDDDYEIDSILNSSEFVTNPDGRVVSLDEGYEMISMGKGNMTPWKCSRDVPEEELERTLESMISKTNDISKSIFNIHVPPYGTLLDVAPELDSELRAVTKAGQPSMIHVGSTAVRKAIEKYQPLLGLHGHIHESKAVEEIGRCLCVNPGSEYAEGILRGALFTLDSGKIKNYVLTTG